MTQYLILIYENEEKWATASEEDFNRILGGHNAFGEKHHAALRGGNALEPTSTATALRADSAGKFMPTDGPFAETKEALGGYYLIEANNLDEAIAIARDVPAEFGGVEVRPIREMN